LAGAEGNPYHVWLDDWSVSASAPETYHLQAQQEGIALDLVLKDKLGIVLQGENGYSRKGESAGNASYYYSQPRLQAEGTVQVNGVRYQVSGLAWNDHEFSTSVLDKNQIGWDWFSLQFDDGSAAMLYQLRERDGGISAASSGTWIATDGSSQHLEKTDFEIKVLGTWQSPHSQGEYPADWQIKLISPKCDLRARPWMADQELNFTAVSYWEGAVRFEGTCDGSPVNGNGYIELTGYAGNVPLP
jgi:predicted secreted hydrolase